MENKQGDAVTQVILIDMKLRTMRAANKLKAIGDSNRFGLACVESLEKFKDPLQKLIEDFEAASLSPSQDTSALESVTAAYHAPCKDGELKLLDEELEYAEIRIARLAR